MQCPPTLIIIPLPLIWLVGEGVATVTTSYTEVILLQMIIRLLTPKQLPYHWSAILDKDNGTFWHTEKLRFFRRVEGFEVCVWVKCVTKS